jgi:hypothetical protein
VYNRTQPDQLFFAVHNYLDEGLSVEFDHAFVEHGVRLLGDWAVGNKVIVLAGGIKRVQRPRLDERVDRDRLVVFGAFVMTTITYDEELTKPSTFEGELVKSEIPDELKLAKTLIEASTAKNFDVGKHKDVYTAKLTQLIEAKIAGKDPPARPMPAVHQTSATCNP